MRRREVSSNGTERESLGWRSPAKKKPARTSDAGDLYTRSATLGKDTRPGSEKIPVIAQ